jgi:hypothetical protein
MSAMPLARAVLTGAFLVGFAGSAFALDGADFAKALNAAYAPSGGQIEFSRADVAGNTVILRDAAIDYRGGQKLPTGDLTFSGVEEESGGGYTVKTLTMPDIDYRKDGNELSVQNIEIDGIQIPPVHPQAGSAPMLIYHTASTGPIKLSDKQGEIFAASGVRSSIDRTAGNAGYDTSFVADGLTLHFDRAKDPKTVKAVKALGYGTVTGALSIKASWQRDGGKVNLSQWQLKLDNVGTLDLTASLSGYTAEFIESLRQMQEKLRANPEDKKARQAYGIAMLGLIQQLNFGGASISFVDDSVTRKVLDYLGKQQGVSGDQMAAAATAMLPMALGRLQNPQFKQQIVDAVGTFLNNPKNIAIKAAPDKPVSVPTIMGAAMAAPQTLPDVLNVTVTANQ